MNKKCITLALAAFLSGLVGCGGDVDNNAANNGNDNVQMHKVGTNNQNGNIGNNANQNLRTSAFAANRVERLKEVDEARVIIRGNDAYVAVRLENGRNGAGTTNTGTGTDYGPGTTNVGIGTGAGYGPGVTNVGTGTGTGYGAGTTNTGTEIGNDAGTANTDNTRLGRTRDRQVSSTLERKITDQVRAADRDIRNVYVSVDPTFFGQMTNYTNDMRDGQNGNGLFEDFTDTVRRFFK